MTTIRIFVQNWRAVTKKSDVSIVKAAFAERFAAVVGDATRCQFQVVGYRPNLGTPLSYDEVMRDDAWNLWNSMIITVEDYDESIEALLRDELGCAVHIEIQDAGSCASSSD